VGKKSERLQEDIDILEAENMALRARIVELEGGSIKDTRGRGTAGFSARSNVLARTVPAVQPDEPHELVGTDLTTEFEPAERAAVSDLQAIQELHRPPPPVDKPETALDVVRANNAERSALQHTTKLQGNLIGRIASAMRVTKWDQDGTEILDKAMQWSTFAHWIKQRQKLATGAVANELGTILAALVAPTDLAAWIMTKTADQVPESALEVASNPESGPPLDLNRRVGIDELKKLLYWSPKDDDVAWWLDAALRSVRGTQELLNLLNMVLIPFLRRIRSVTDTPIAPNAPTRP